MPEFMAGAAARRRQRRERATSQSPFLLNFLDPALEEQFRISHARNAMLVTRLITHAQHATPLSSCACIDAVYTHQPLRVPLRRCDPA